MTDEPQKTTRSRGIVLIVLGVLAAVVLLIWRPWTADSTPPPSRPVALDTDNEGTREGTLEEALDIARNRLAAMEETLIDYRGRMTKRELVGGELMPENEMEFKIRTRRAGHTDGSENQPMAVYLRFVRPESATGREAIWRENVHDGWLVVHETGLLGLVPVPPLDPNGFLAMQGNRYPITQIGFKNLVGELLKRGKRIAELGGADVTFREDYKVGDRSCLLIQVRPKFKPGVGDAKDIEFSLAEIAIDSERHIPLRYAAYGVPAKPDDPLPIQEEYVYLDVELNVGLTDADFDPDNPAYKFP